MVLMLIESIARNREGETAFIPPRALLEILPLLRLSIATHIAGHTYTAHQFEAWTNYKKDIDVYNVVDNKQVSP
jgi:hypothetical protein